MNLARRLVLLTLFAATPALAQVTAIRAGAVIDPGTGKLTRNQLILVEGGKVTSVSSDTRAPAGANVIDLSHSYVLPGLMDAHTHISWNSGWGDEGTYARLETTSTAFRALMAIKLAREALNSGFTTLRDVETEGAGYGDVGIKEAINEGYIPGPRMFVSTRAISVTSFRAVA